MNANVYEILSLAMRYVFAALMALIVLRAWRVTAVDSRRSTRLRRLNPQTGLIGELIVADGEGRIRTGKSYPVILEGTIGSAGRADIRVRHPSVRGIHADYQMTDEGLCIQVRGNARLRDAVGRRVKELTLHDGDYFVVGTIRFMLVLTGADFAPEELERSVRSREGARRDESRRRERRGEYRERPERRRREEAYELFETGRERERAGDDLFEVAPDNGYDDYEDYEDYDDGRP